MSRSLQAAVFGGLLGLLVAFGGSAGAAAREHTTVVLGNTATMPDPSCPESPCQAIGSVTGFQVSTSQGSLACTTPNSTICRWPCASAPSGVQAWLAIPS